MYFRWLKQWLNSQASPQKTVRLRPAKRQTYQRRLSLENLETRDLLTTLPFGFQENLVASGLYEPTSTVVAPDGRLFVTEKPFGVRIIENGQLLTTPLLSLNVERGGERGVQGVLLDPNFSTNGFFYVYYTHATASGSFDRLSRFSISTTSPNIADPASEVVLVDGIATIAPGYHNGGLLQFGADGMLYVGIGDTTISSLPQDLSQLQGKILRLDPYSATHIPADNPFVNTPGARGEIWAYGFRNPFTGSMLPGTNRLFVNDVGSNKFEEIDEVIRGGNFGWPLAEGVSTDPTLVNPIYSYAHGTTGAAITGGAFYTGSSFPASYQGKYFFSDYAQSFIKTLDIQTGAVTTFAPDAFIPVDIASGPGGSLYWLSLGMGSGTDGALYQITYVGGNRAPVAVSTADVGSGLAPLTVNFSGTSSSDPDGDAITYAWDFGDGTTATGATVVHTYAANGTYYATLSVSDGQVTTQATPLRVVVGNLAPTPTITLPLTGTKYKAGDTISFAGSATDAEDGPLAASQLSWRAVFHHDQHIHPFIDSIAGVSSGTFQIPLTGEVDANQWYRIELTATDSIGLTTTTYFDVIPQTSLFTLASNVPGIPLLLDGQPISAGAITTGVVNMQRTISAPVSQFFAGVLYRFAGWSDGGSITHTISTPALASTITATYLPAINDVTFSGTPPTNWLPGEVKTYTITATNTGTSTWMASGANPVHLGAYFDGRSDAIYDWPTEPIRFNLTSDVSPGASATFTVTMVAPATSSGYVLRHRLVQEGVQWFAPLLKANTVVAQPILASYTATVPPVWPAGSTQTIPVTIKNLGTETWTAAGNNPVRLAAYFDAPSDQVGAWTSEPLRFTLPSDVAPGASVTVNMALAAPLATGDHVLRYRMVKEASLWSANLATAAITVGTLSAQYSGSVPLLWNAGETKTFTMTVTNNGDFTWLSTGTRAVQLAAYFGASSDAPLSWTTEPLRFALPRDVAPGQSAQVSVTLAAPLTAGESTLRLRMVKEQNWFTPLLSVVTTIGTLTASYTTTAPSAWGLSATKVFTTTVTNTGTVTWQAGGVRPVKLAVYFDGTSDAVGAWTTDPMRVTLPQDVAPGQSVTLTITLTAPATAGTYTLRQRMVKESVAWFDPPQKTTMTVAKGTLAATYTSTPPTTWLNGQTIPYTITLTNTGTQTWNRTGTNPVRLGIYFGTASDAVGAWSTEPARFDLPSDVAPGASVTMTINVTAPATANGNYTLRARLVKDNVAWFDYFQKTAVVVQTLTASYSGIVPTSWTRGQTQTYSMTVTNTGSATWNTSGTNPVRLAVYFGTASDAVGGWPTEPTRIAWPANVTSVAPGQSVTISVTMRAPTTAGSYILRQRMVKENVRWFNEMLKTNATVI
ncbi:MAG: PQQ-dependent sugar dehydrogenase [Planctomycetaceae bacterium]